jgi:hypothetical protein
VSVAAINSVLAADVAAIDGVLAADVAAVDGIAFSGGGPTDPYFANVVLLCPFDVDFTDESVNGFTLSGTGTPTVTGGSLDVDSGDFLTAADTTPLIPPGTGEWTIEVYAFPEGTSDGGFGSFYIMGENEASGHTLCIRQAELIYRRAGTTDASGSATITSEKHVAFACHDVSGTRTVYGYVDGVLALTASLSNNLNSPDDPKIGCASGNPTFGFKGTLRGLRVTNGVCRYPGGTTFTPPTLPLPTS